MSTFATCCLDRDTKNLNGLDWKLNGLLRSNLGTVNSALLGRRVAVGQRQVCNGSFGVEASLENMISYNTIFVSAVVICWLGRLDRGEALDGTMPKSKKGPRRKATRCDLICYRASDADDRVCDKEGTSQCRFGVIG